ncbi:hypothetical protein PBAL39_19300 [Pedobacter sp. BAL39]|uniref:THUMP-like domain-containing protein n=1 Tax=Pedobacter sp. BAL39 TaxID=391596 RepID=UPI000155AD6E|nr:hypothetical protein [Pedobacter sp. BAL39]EDM34469.1 hypothetical protein PBAL39_19300 [Pedobacter sp. BAL39]
MNPDILDSEVQHYIRQHLHEDAYKIAMAKSPFPTVSGQELAGQIVAKQKCLKKLPLWYERSFLYFPPVLSIEQCSSERTAIYKSRLALKGTLIDLTGGFGVDSFYFAKSCSSVTHCELNQELSEIAAHNAATLGQDNLTFFAGDGIAQLQNNTTHYDNIYIDPARRGTMGKVFMLKDCTPNVVENLSLLLSRAHRVILKTAPLLDLSSGLKELHHVAEIHIVSVRNECKELVWILEKKQPEALIISCITLNEEEKIFSFIKGEEELEARLLQGPVQEYLYEPDAALLKSGAFNLIGERYGLFKLQHQTQLYTSASAIPEFPGRRFKVRGFLSATTLKKEKNLKANVISRNYPDKAEQLVKKYKIKPDQLRFLIFTQTKDGGNVIIDTEIEQHY